MKTTPLFAALLVVLFASSAFALFRTNFNALDVFYEGGSGRVELNASCEGYDAEFLQGDLVRFKVTAVYSPSNETKLLKQSFLVYVEPCAEVSRDVYLLEFPENSSSVNLFAAFARADYPLNFYPYSFSQSFEVRAKPVTSNLSVDLSTASVGGEAASWFGNWKAPKPWWLTLAVLALFGVGFLLMFYFSQFKFGLLVFLIALAALSYLLFA